MRCGWAVFLVQPVDTLFPSFLTCGTLNECELCACIPTHQYPLGKREKQVILITDVDGEECVKGLCVVEETAPPSSTVCAGVDQSILHRAHKKAAHQMLSYQFPQHVLELPIGCLFHRWEKQFLLASMMDLVGVLPKESNECCNVSERDSATIGNAFSHGIKQRQTRFDMSVFFDEHLDQSCGSGNPLHRDSSCM
jgi:hypothetical protein